MFLMFLGYNQSWWQQTVLLPIVIYGHVRWLTPIELRVPLLRGNIQVFFSLSNPLKKISLRSTQREPTWVGEALAEYLR